MKFRVLQLVLTLFVLLGLAAPASVWAAAGDSPAGLADGAGVWANIWNYPQGDLDAYCSQLRSFGVRNIFIQTSRSNMPAVAHPEDLGRLIDACHRHKIRVIGWAYLELANPDADADKMLAAARFTSPAGGKLDAIAPDLEKNLSVERVEAFSEKLRRTLGNSYPLIACVYSPLNHYSEVKNIPWKVLSNYYDVLAPMSYWNSKYQKLDAYDYTLATVREIRNLTGRPDVEIHVIGDAMGSNGATISRFMSACQKAGATSASLYPNQRATQEQLASLSHYQDYFPPNARFRLAAFREMIRSGALENPPMDPTRPIARAEFYKMLGRYSHAALPALEVSDSPMYADEALTLLAQIVDVQPIEKTKKRRADRWFAPPAMAEAPQRQHADKPINYLDAAQMVLEAGSVIVR